MPEVNAKDNEYLIEVIRDSLEGFSGRIADEEAGASTFLENQVMVIDGVEVNVARFAMLTGGDTLPDTPTFVAIGGVPEGKVAQWTGVIRLRGANMSAAMFR
jgi:hypothetical protein